MAKSSSQKYFEPKTEIKILQKRESTATKILILKCNMVTSHDVHTVVDSRIRVFTDYDISI